MVVKNVFNRKLCLLNNVNLTLTFIMFHVAPALLAERNL